MANGQNPDDEQEQRNRYRTLREREAAPAATGGGQEPPENRYRQLRDTTTWTPEPEPEPTPSIWDRARQLAGRVKEGVGRIQADTGELEEATAAGMTGSRRQPQRTLSESPATRGQDLTFGPDGVRLTAAVDGPQTATGPEPDPVAVDGPPSPQGDQRAPSVPDPNLPAIPSSAWLRDIERERRRQGPQTRLPGAPLPDPFDLQNPMTSPIPDEVLDRQGPELAPDHSYLKEAALVFPRGVGMTIEGTGNMIQALSMRRFTRGDDGKFPHMGGGRTLTGDRIGETEEAIPFQRATGRFISDAGGGMREQFAPSESVQAGGALQLKNPRWWLASGGDAVFTLGLSLGTGGVATGLGWGRAAQLAAFSTPTAVLEGGMAYGETLDYLLEQGLSEDEAHAAASGVAYLTAAGAVLVEQLPGRLFMFDELPGLQSAFGKKLATRMASSRLVQVGAAMGAESLQEISQEAWADVVQMLVVENPDAFADWFDRYAAAGILGGLAGGLARAGQVTIESQKLRELEREVAPFLNSLPQDVRADVEIALGLRAGTESSSASETFVPSEAEAPPAGVGERRSLRRMLAGLIDRSIYEDKQFGVMNRNAFQEAYKRMDAREDVSAVILDVINLHGMNEILGSHAAADAVMAPLVETMKQIHAELGGIQRDLFRRDGDAFVAYVPAGQEQRFVELVQERVGLVQIPDSDFVTGFRVAAGPTSEIADRALFEVKKSETFRRYRDEADPAPASEQQQEPTTAPVQPVETMLEPALEALAEEVAGGLLPGMSDPTDAMALHARLKRLPEADREAVIQRGRALHHSRFDEMGMRRDQAPTVEPSQEFETVVAAAVQLPDGRVVTGGTHGSIQADLIEQGAINMMDEDINGFVTSTGRFVGREEGTDLADRAGQLDPDHPAVGTSGDITVSSEELGIASDAATQLEQPPVQEWDTSKLRPGEEWTPLPLTDQMRVAMAEIAQRMGATPKRGATNLTKQEEAAAEAFDNVLTKWRRKLSPLEYDSLIAHMRKAQGFPLQEPFSAAIDGEKRLLQDVPRETVSRLYDELARRDDDFGIQARRTIRMWEAGDIGVAQVVEDIGRIEDGLLAYLEEPVDLGSFARAWQEHTGTEFPQIFETWLPRRAFIEENGIDALPDPVELRTSVVNTAAHAERIRAEIEAGVDPETGYGLNDAQVQGMTEQFQRVQRRFIEQAELFRAAFGSEPANLVFADFLDVETDALSRFVDRVKLYVRPGKIGEAHQLMQDWSDKKLTDRYEQYVRRWTKLFIKGARTEASDARVNMNNWGEIIAGTKTTESGKNARGNRSQQAARIVAAASLMQQRGLPIRTEREITSEVKRADIDEWNRELYDALPSMDLELVQAEVQRTMHERGKTGNQINQRLDERMFLLYRELERRGVDDIDLEGGTAERFDGVRETRPTYVTRNGIMDMEGHWWSRVLRAIDDAKYRHPKTGGQWIAELVKRSPKGVSKAELEFDGFREWLHQRHDTPLTTEEVREAAEARVPRFTETVYGPVVDWGRPVGAWRRSDGADGKKVWTLEDALGEPTGYTITHFPEGGEFYVDFPATAPVSLPTRAEAIEVAERDLENARRRASTRRTRYQSYTYQKYGERGEAEAGEIVIQYRPAQMFAGESLFAPELEARLEETSEMVKRVHADVVGTDLEVDPPIYSEHATLLDYRDFADRALDTSYKHGHWVGVMNPLAHLRLTTRRVGDVQYRHIEEAQSDIHQDARGKGVSDGRVAGLHRELKKAISDWKEATAFLFGEGIAMHTKFGTATLFRRYPQRGPGSEPNLHAQYQIHPRTTEEGRVVYDLWDTTSLERLEYGFSREGALEAFQGQLLVGDADFFTHPTEEQGEAIIKARRAFMTITGRNFLMTDELRAELAPQQETSEWAGMLVRRAFMDAALRGKDGVSLATGDQAREALGLRQQGIERIVWHHAVNNLELFNPNGELIGNRFVRPEELNNYVGAEVAKELVRQSNTLRWDVHYGRGIAPPQWQGTFDTRAEAEAFVGDDTDFYSISPSPAVVQGEGLEVGGMGNRAFYDEIMVGVVEKEAKRWGLEVDRELIMSDIPTEQAQWGAWVVDELNVPADLTDVGLTWVEGLFERRDELVDDSVVMDDLTEIFAQFRSIPVEERQEAFLDMWRDGTVDIDIRNFLTRLLGHDEVHIVYNLDDVNEQILAMEPTREEAIIAAREQSAVFDGIFAKENVEQQLNLVVRIPPEVRARILNEGMPTVREHNRAAFGSESAQLDAFDMMVELSYAAKDRLELVRSVGSHAALELRGQVVSDPATAALLVRPWRSKQVESFGMLFMGPGGEVLGQEVLTSGAIDYVAFSHRHFAEANARATRLGATQMLIWHNHPSGDPTPSTEDQTLVDTLHRYMRARGGPAIEALILNDTVATWWRPGGTPAVVDLGTTPTEVAPTARQVIRSPNDAAQFATNLQGVKPGTFMALYVDTKHRIVVAEPHQRSAADSMAEWMPQKLSAYGARSVIFVVGQNENKLFEQLTGRVVSELFVGTKVLDVVQEAGGLPARTGGTDHPRWHDASLMARQGEKFNTAWSKEDGPNYAAMAERAQDERQDERQGPIVVLGHTRSGKLIERLKENGWGRMEITSEETGVDRDDFLNDDPYSREGIDAGATELYPEGRDPYRTKSPLAAYQGEPWAVDTGAFVEASRHGGIRDAEEFFGTWLRRVRAVAKLPESSRPFMVILPDVPFNGAESLETSREWIGRAPEGLSYYLPVQDGMTPAQVAEFLDSPDGQKVAGVFLGGTDQFKSSEDAAWVEFAHDRGLRFHYARAGTPGKLKRAMQLGADSVDSAFPLWTMDRFNEFERIWKGDPGPQTELLLTPPAPELRVREGGPDLFGEAGPERVQQGDLMGPAPTDTPSTALATVSRLEGKVRRGQASESELVRYEQARSLLRVNQGQGLDEAEIRARREDDGTTPEDNLDLFTTREVGPEYDPIGTDAAEIIRQEVARLEDELAHLGDDMEAFFEYDRIEADLDELQSRLEVAEAIERGEPEAAAELLWGTTDIPTGGVYVLADGSFLDGSQADEGGNPGYRVLDHRSVGVFFVEELGDAGSGKAFMTEFMRRGNIRWSQTSNGTTVIDFIQTPTPAQLRTMREAISEGSTVYIMRSSRDGVPIAERRLMGPDALEMTVQQLAEFELGDPRIMPSQDGDVTEDTQEGDAYMELDSFDEAPAILNTDLPSDLTGFDQIVAPSLMGRLEAPVKPIPGTPVSASQVIASIARIAEAAGRFIPIRVGRIAMRRALGVFKVRPEIMRVLIANDIPTAIHEAAHALEKVMWGWKRGGPWTAKVAGVNKKMQSELVAMGEALYGSRKPAGGYKREGWAEFLRAYVTQDEATLALAPAFREWFEWTFLSEHKDIAGAINETRWMTARYQGQGSVNRARANMEDPAGPASRWKRQKGMLKRAFSFEKWIDMAEPLQRLSREVEERTGRRLDPTEDPYQLVTALRTTHSARVKRMITEGMIDFAGNRVGPPLDEVRVHVKPNQYEDFAIFLWAKRAIALLTDPQGARNPGMSLIDAHRIIEEIGSDAFERAASMVYEWNAGALNYAAQSSPTFREVVKAVRKRDPGYYVPLQRVFDDLTDAWSQAPKGAAANQRSPVKRLKGSGRRVKDPIQAMIAQAEAMVKAAHNRAVIDAIVKISQLEGLGYLIEEVPRDLIPQAQRNAVQVFEDLRRALRREGSPVDIVPMVEGEDGPFIPDMISIEEHLQDIMVTFFGPKLEPDNKDPIVPIYTKEKGITWYQVDETLYETLNSMDVYRLPSIAGIPALEATLGFATNVFRAGTTGLRASFGLLWNPLRDFQTFYVNTRSSANSAVMFKEYLSSLMSGALYRTTGQSNNPYLQAFLDVGGEMALPLGQDLPHTRRAAHRIIQGRIARTLDARNWFDWYRDFIQFPEYAPRVAELALIAKEIGWEPGTPMTQSQSLELLIAAKQVTTDFTAAGELSRIVNRMVPFHNASIQGPRANVRAAMIGADERAQARASRGGDRARKVRDLAASRFMWRGMILTASSLMLWWRNKDEDWWQELDARERATHWWFSAKMGDREELVRIPRAFEVGMVFSALPEALAEAAYRERPEEFSQWFETFVNVSFPPMVPQPMEVMAEQLAGAGGRQFYFDRPIVPMSEVRLPAREQYNEYTSVAARGLAEILSDLPGIPELSPRRIDHAIQGMFGPVSRDLIELLGLGGEGARRGGREAEKSDMVILGRLFYRGGPAGPNESVDKLYDELEVLQRRQASMRHIESPQETQRRLMLQDAAQAITGVSLVQRAIEDSDRRRQLMALRTAIAKSALEAQPAQRPVFQQLRVQWQRSAEQVQTARDAAGGS